MEHYATLGTSPGVARKHNGKADDSGHGGTETLAVVAGTARPRPLENSTSGKIGQKWGTRDAIQECKCTSSYSQRLE
jgi:hypothetical protein